MTDTNGIFTVSDLAGTDPHSLWITGLPHAEQPHVWEQPSTAWADVNQFTWENLMIDASNRTAASYIGRPPLSEGALQRSWEFAHPVRARLVRWLSR